MSDSEDNLLTISPPEILRLIMTFVDPEDYNSVKYTSPGTYEFFSSPHFVEQYLSDHNLLPEHWKARGLQSYFLTMYKKGWSLYSFQLKTKDAIDAALAIILKVDDIEGFRFLEKEGVPINLTLVENHIPYSPGLNILCYLLDNNVRLDYEAVAVTSLSLLNANVLYCLHDKGITMDWYGIRRIIGKRFGTENTNWERILVDFGGTLEDYGITLKRKRRR